MLIVVRLGLLLLPRHVGAAHPQAGGEGGGAHSGEAQRAQRWRHVLLPKKVKTEYEDMIAAHDMLFDSTADSEGCPVLVVVLQESMNDTSRRWRGEGLRVIPAAPREDDWDCLLQPHRR